MQRAAETARAVNAAVAVARAHGVRCDDPLLIDDRVNVVVHLRPAPVVARVPGLSAEVRRGDDWLRREVVVASFLGARGAPVVGPSPELPPGPHSHDGHWLTFWEQVEHDPGRSRSVEEVARLLRELHLLLAEFDGKPLPLLEPVIGELPGMIGHLEGAGGLSDADAALLRRAYERLRPSLAAARGPLQAVHGDAHPGNLLETAAGPLWADFEETCAAPVEWDVACLSMSSSAFGGDAVAAYGADTDPEQLELCEDARALQLACWTALVALRDPTARDLADARLRWWREREAAAQDG